MLAEWLTRLAHEYYPNDKQASMTIVSDAAKDNGRRHRGPAKVIAAEQGHGCIPMIDWLSHAGGGLCPEPRHDT